MTSRTSACLSLPKGDHNPNLLSEWRQCLSAPSDTEASLLLRALYRHARPSQAEMIFSGACSFACQHCIYPPEYPDWNRSMAPEKWARILTALRNELSIDTFIYSGRSVTSAGVRTLRWLREEMPNARIGLIDNGISIIPHCDELEEARLDWIDISFDGLAEAHDLQRSRAGSFAAALDGVTNLLARRLAPKLSVLTCLTSLNQSSIADMIRFLHQRGLKNFVVTPVVIIPHVRPDPLLAVPPENLREVATELKNVMVDLTDSYVEFSLFQPEHLAGLFAGRSDFFAGFRAANDHFAWASSVNGNEFSIRYFPVSLAGVREVIVNADGRIVSPGAIALGRIPKNHTFGDPLRQRVDGIWDAVPGSSGFQFYIDELVRERQVLAAFDDLIWRG